MAKTQKEKDPLTPSIPLLVKLGSLIVHYDECKSGDGHAFDVAAINSLLSDPEVEEWIRGMDKLSLLPKNRK